jgi:single-strand DNA-binding protein
MLPTITINGRAVNDPELRFTQSGAAVANFRVAASESKKNDRGEWEDGDKLFVNVSVWKDDAEAIAEHIRKGDKVVVSGRLFQREYETNAGEKRTSIEVKFATVAKVIDAPRAQRTSQPQQPANDPWAAPAGNDAPPF